LLYLERILSLMLRLSFLTNPNSHGRALTIQEGRKENFLIFTNKSFLLQFPSQYPLLTCLDINIIETADSFFLSSFNYFQTKCLKHKTFPKPFKDNVFLEIVVFHFPLKQANLKFRHPLAPNCVMNEQSLQLLWSKNLLAYHSVLLFFANLECQNRIGHYMMTCILKLFYFPTLLSSNK